MYAILVEEPGGEPSSYILPTGARTSESAMRLMSSRAEEFIDEQMEQEDQAEDYTITAHDDLLSVDVRDSHGNVAIEFTATALDQVV